MSIGCKGREKEMLWNQSDPSHQTKHRARDCSEWLIPHVQEVPHGLCLPPDHSPSIWSHRELVREYSHKASMMQMASGTSCLHSPPISFLRRTAHYSCALQGMFYVRPLLLIPVWISQSQALRCLQMPDLQTFMQPDIGLWCTELLCQVLLITTGRFK